ncbi:BTB/POZ domain-containing protein At3g05675 isoform X2 [Ananas comosus]|uniref:BTB/POZ domain-containing protein At3g05675 isoform X2 n=1 Tax=Ananas comosus TaxID=4615 RepID=A0A6P5FYF2_ANACO|nr:BTB/POZ domain-containing protein At3g05675 isoform X2 [Ananas comosus]
MSSARESAPDTPPFSEEKKIPQIPMKIGDRSTSDVVVRVRTHEGRDSWFYCHSQILIENCKYFAERLSDDWPTCQILDSRYCVEVYCEESDFNSHVAVLRLFYVSKPYTWHGVRNTLGILQVVVHLGCPKLARDCVGYLESVPWEEGEEEEILKTIPHLGPHYEHVLDRLRPVNSKAVIQIFVLAFRFATSSPPPLMREMKCSAQDQLEYMLTEDDEDDSLFLTSDADIIKFEVKNCVKNLLTKFDNFVKSLVTKSATVLDENTKTDLRNFLFDILWTCQILSKMEMMRDLVHYWVNASSSISTVADQLSTDCDDVETRLKVVEITSKVLEAIGFGNVVLPTAKRLNLVNTWLPFVRRTMPMLEQVDTEGDDAKKANLDSDIWQGLESALVSIVLTLPSDHQAEILAEWLRSKHVRYPDLTEAFEVWCYRSKVAKRRLAFLEGMNSD